MAPLAANAFTRFMNEADQMPIDRNQGTIMARTTDLSVCIVQPNRIAVSKPLLLTHAKRRPGSIIVHHDFLPTIDEQHALDARPTRRGFRRLKRRLFPLSAHEEAVNAYARFFKTKKTTVVLAEYGPIGVHVLEACRRLAIPLVVHFHEYDVSETSVPREQADGYVRLFKEASALVVVSNAMKRQLISLGAPWQKIHCNACGVDCEYFAGADPASAPPTLLSVGRFVVKKAPHLTIQAFAEARASIPEARLRMIGDGPLLASCQTLVEDLGVQDAVTFLGAQPPDVVRAEMRAARAFVQHSVRALSGDSEGMPVSVVEAGASGLPIVSTRHAGIPEAVLDGETGLLVEERDAAGMAAAMRRVLDDPLYAASLGRASRAWIVSRFRLEDSIDRLWGILGSCLEAEAPAVSDRFPFSVASREAEASCP